MPAPEIKFEYRNHRGVTELRTVTPDRIVYDADPERQYGYAPGWFLVGYCHDRKGERKFAFTHMGAPGITIPISGHGHNILAVFRG